MRDGSQSHNDPSTQKENEMTTPTAPTAHEEVDALAAQLVENGRFDTMAKARMYVYESRPHLYEAAKAASEVGTARPQRSGKRAATAPTGALAEVEELALKQLDSGKAKTIQQARAHVYRAQPELAEKVRAEAAGAEPEPAEGSTPEDIRAIVEELAGGLVENGKFATIEDARAHVLDTRRDLTKALGDAMFRAKPVIAKRVVPVDTSSKAREEVEQLAKAAVEGGKFPTIQQARAHVYETKPELAERVREEARS